MADETTDMTTKEKLSLTVRYIDDNSILHEDFLQFYEIESLTGSDLASSILNGDRGGVAHQENFRFPDGPVLKDTR